MAHMGYIVFVAIGDHAIIQESLVSLQTLLKVTDRKFWDSHRVLVYTDMPERYGLFSMNPNIIIETVSQQKAYSWTDGNKYKYKVKICALLDALQRYNSTVVLVDTDTMFLSSPETLFEDINTNRIAILNYAENTLEQIVEREKLRMLPERRDFFFPLYESGKLQYAGNTYLTPPETGHWNSGVIGLCPAHKGLLLEALHLSDYIFEKYGLRTSEQLALSYVFQNKSALHSSKEVLFHYWPFQECRYILENYFSRSLYDYPRQHMRDFVIRWIQQIRQWDIPYNLLFDLMVCILHYKRKQTQAWNYDFESDSFMRKIICDKNYFQSCLQNVGTYCDVKGCALSELLPCFGERNLL